MESMDWGSESGQGQGSSADNPIESVSPPLVPVAPPRVSVEGALHPLGDHAGFLYYADDVGRPPTIELPDEFFEPSKSDVDTVWRSLQAQRKDLEDAPLLTSKFRNQYQEDEVLRNLRQNPVSLVRIRFPNRYVLQGTFRGVDTLEAVTNFVKKFLVDPNINFYLFTSPPRVVLSSEKRLVEQGLVGCTVMYFGCKDTTVLDFLKPDLYTQVSCPQAVFRNNRALLENKPALDPASMHIQSGEVENSGGSPVAGSSGACSRPPHNRGSAPSGLVPKWFKTGRK